MRTWICLAALVGAIGCVGGYWFYLRNSSATNGELIAVTDRPRLFGNAKGDGDAEASEVIEPLVVDRGPGAVPPGMPPARDDGPLPRVEWTSGIKQPPRPDAEFGRVVRMPYADEEDFLDLAKDPVTRLLEADLPRLNIFEEIENTSPAEEAAPNEPAPPAMDPHHHHCPYHGGCPVPYPYRMMPR